MPAPADFAGDASSPPLIITFGDSGLGKTTDSLYSFPNAMFIPVTVDAVRPASTVCGYNLRKDQVVACRTLSQLMALLIDIRDKQRQAGRLFYPEYVIDDLSELAKNQLTAMKASGKYDAGGGNYSFLLWTDLTDLINDIGSICRHDMGAKVVFNAHRRPPETDNNGVYWKGGPLFPSKKLTRSIPHLATSVYQVGIDDEMWGEHKGVYRNLSPDPSWHMKCRLNWQGVLPMNLAELLRCATPISWNVTRHPDLTWMEKWVKGATNALMAEKDWSKVSKKVVEKVLMKRSGTSDQHLVWILRDATSRAYLMKSRQTSRLSAWGA